MHTVNVQSTRNYGKMSHTIGITVPYENEPGQLAIAYKSAQEQVNVLFEDFETHELPKIQFKMIENGAAGTGEETIKHYQAHSVVKEVKDGKEYIRVKTMPGTFFHKFGVAVYPECEGYESLLLQLGKEYSKVWNENQGAKIVVQESGTKKVLKFSIEVPF